MSEEANSLPWLLFLPQQQAGSSTARVSLWRQLRSVGATSATQGAWILPNNEVSLAAFTRLSEVTRENGGIAVVFGCAAIEGLTDNEIISRFRSDRSREYDEFKTRADDFFAEIEKETRQGKFKFAELEEIEHDLERTRTWLSKIMQRDFFADERQANALTILASCENAFRVFAEKVYEHEHADGAGSSEL